MSDHSTDEIRALLARAVSDAPDPHRWDDVEQRARQHHAPPPARRRTGVWLAAAACTIALVAGLIAVVTMNDEPTVRTDDPVDTTPSTAASTSVPAPAPAIVDDLFGGGWTGGLLDDIDVDALSPLDSFNSFLGPGVIIPTAPRGLRVEDAGHAFDESSSDDPLLYPNARPWRLDVAEAPADSQPGQEFYFRQSQFPVCLGCKLSGDSVTINGVVWESTDDQFLYGPALRGRVDQDTWLSIVVGVPELLNGPLLEDPQIIELLEGLRVGSTEDLAAIANDAATVANDD